MLYTELVGPSKKEFTDAIKDAISDECIEITWTTANTWREATLVSKNLFIRSVIHNDVLYVYIRRYQ